MARGGSLASPATNRLRQAGIHGAYGLRHWLGRAIQDRRHYLTRWTSMSGWVKRGDAAASDGDSPPSRPSPWKGEGAKQTSRRAQAEVRRTARRVPNRAQRRGFQRRDLEREVRCSGGVQQLLQLRAQRGLAAALSDCGEHSGACHDAIDEGERLRAKLALQPVGVAQRSGPVAALRARPRSPPDRRRRGCAPETRRPGSARLPPGSACVPRGRRSRVPARRGSSARSS